MAEASWPVHLTHTADGQPIAGESPRGVSVAVRRHRPGHDQELLILHRRERPPRGPWAWTSPSGCRRPGEAVVAGMHRELAEETGLTGLSPWAVDMSGVWAAACVDVDPDVVIDLVDPEHDEYTWLSVDEAADRVLPAFVVEEQIAPLARIPAVRTRFRPMRDTDLADVARWRSAEHVRPWFDGGATVRADTVAARFRERMAQESTFRLWVVEVDGRSAGYLQSYRVADQPVLAAKAQDPAAVAFDYVLGEAEMTGRGLGTRVIWEFCRDVLVSTYPEAPRFVATPSHRNGASVRALEKCGFAQGLWIDAVAAPGERPDTEIVCTLDRGHWFGSGAATLPSSRPGRPSSSEA